MTTHGEQTAWLAGIIEGEGYIAFKKQRYPGVVVQMTDEDVILRLAEFSGAGHVSGPLQEKLPHHKPTWRWEVTDSTDAVALLRRIRPWLGTRRGARVDDVLARFEANPLPGRGRRSDWDKVCRNGHIRSEETTYRRPNGRWECDICRQERAA